MGEEEGVRAALGDTAGFWELTVEDDGPGLEPEDRERVLERGERLDESVPGSGLGPRSLRISPSSIRVRWRWASRGWAALKRA